MIVSTEPKRINWQLSLANVLIFVVALGLWFALFASRSGPLMVIALLLTPAGYVLVWRAWLDGRYALLLLACVFNLIVVVGAKLIIARDVGDWAQQHYRVEALASIARSMNLYYADWNAYPPPPADSRLCGFELARYLSMQRKNDPTRPYYQRNLNSDQMYATNGALLKWQLQDNDILILIDAGKDGIAGKYSVEDKKINKTHVDTNHDGIDDGADDAVISRTRGERD